MASGYVRQSRRATWERLSAGGRDEVRLAAVRGGVAKDSDSGWLLSVLIEQQLGRVRRTRRWVLPALPAMVVVMGAVSAWFAGGSTTLRVIVLAAALVMAVAAAPGTWLAFLLEQRRLTRAQEDNVNATS